MDALTITFIIICVAAGADIAIVGTSLLRIIRLLKQYLAAQEI
jgi:hypothetical protein